MTGQKEKEENIFFNLFNFLVLDMFDPASELPVPKKETMCLFNSDEPRWAKKRSFVLFSFLDQSPDKLYNKWGASYTSTLFSLKECG